MAKENGTGNSMGNNLSTANDKSTLANKLNDIPLEQLKELLTSQIDLEIQLKHRELHLSNQELNKIEAQMILLRKYFEIPANAKLSNEPDDFTTKYFDLLNNSLTVSYNELKKRQESLDNAEYCGGQSSYSYTNDNNSAYYDDLSKFSIDSSLDNSPCAANHPFYRTRSTTSSLRPSSIYSELTPQPQPADNTSITPTPNPPQKGLGCLYKRTDGIVVKLTCPQCQRSNFSSAQGFLNHSRIAHSQEYTSQDAAALKCGQIVDSIKQDFEGQTSLRNLLSKNLDPNTNLNIPEINFNANVKSLPEKSKSPTCVDNSSLDSSIQATILLKKLNKAGKINKIDYEKLILDTKTPIVNSHLFDDEEDDDTSGSSDLNKSESTFSELVSKRRKSRGGINIMSIKTSQTEDNDDGNENGNDNGNGIENIHTPEETTDNQSEKIQEHDSGSPNQKHDIASGKETKRRRRH